MTRKCIKCDNLIPKFIVIDDKKSNLQRRKYCLDCSPFGEHNTSKLEKIRLEGTKRIKICSICNKEHYQNTYKCASCYFQEKQKNKIKQVQKIVGNSCWICGYNKTWSNLCFHHVNSKLKKFGLTTRELMLA